MKQNIYFILIYFITGLGSLCNKICSNNLASTCRVIAARTCIILLHITQVGFYFTVCFRTAVFLDIAVCPSLVLSTDMVR